MPSSWTGCDRSPAGRAERTGGPGGRVPTADVRPAIRPGYRCGSPICGGSGRPSTIPDSRPACTGWTSPTGPAHGAGVTRGVGIRHPATGGAVRCAGPSIVATGGGSRSVPWMQAVADTTGLPVDTVAVPEGAALGAAFLARIGVRARIGLPGLEEVGRDRASVEPDPGWAAAAAVRFTRFESMGTGIF